MSAYKWKTGAHILVSAEKAGEMCEKLAAENRLTAENLLDANRAPDAPLHQAFEWDNEIAAEEYRKGQARHIIACLCVVTENKKEEIRAFFNLERKEPTYTSIRVIQENPDDMERLFRVATSELAAFQRKYASVRRLQTVFDAIDQLPMEEPDIQHKEDKG